jgi:hypothetical protein
MHARLDPRALAESIARSQVSPESGVAGWRMNK